MSWKQCLLIKQHLKKPFCCCRECHLHVFVFLFQKKNQTDSMLNNMWINRALSLMETRSCKHAIILTWANYLSKSLKNQDTFVYKVFNIKKKIAFNYYSNKTGRAYNARLYETSCSYRGWVNWGIEQSFLLSETTKQLTFRSDGEWHLLSKRKTFLFLMETQTYCIDLSTYLTELSTFLV